MGTRSKKNDLILGRTRQEWAVIIRKKRRELEMSQGTLAAQLGISIVGVCQIEQGKYIFNEKQLMLACEILGI
jgi:ribosome-binding protein aMBF1 (putative translation factor)